MHAGLDSDHVILMLVFIITVFMHIIYKRITEIIMRTRDSRLRGRYGSVLQI